MDQATPCHLRSLRTDTAVTYKPDKSQARNEEAGLDCDAELEQELLSLFRSQVTSFWPGRNFTEGQTIPWGGCCGVERQSMWGSKENSRAERLWWATGQDQGEIWPGRAQGTISQGICAKEHKRWMGENNTCRRLEMGWKMCNHWIKVCLKIAQLTLFKASTHFWVLIFHGFSR